MNYIDGNRFANIDCWLNSDNFSSIQKQIGLFLKFTNCNINRKKVHFFVDEEFIDQFNMVKGVTTMLYQNGSTPVKFRIPSRPGPS